MKHTLALMLFSWALCAQSVPTVVNEWLTPISASYPKTITYYNGFLYITTTEAPARLVKLDVSNPSSQNTITFAADGKHDYSYDAVLVGGYLYVRFAGTAVSRVDPTTLGVTDVIYDAGGVYSPGSLATDGTNLFLTTYGFPLIPGPVVYSTILQYRISDFSLVDRLALTAWFAIDVKWDYVTGKLYITSDGSPMWSARVGVGPLTQEDLQYFDASSSASGIPIAMTDAYLWAPQEASGALPGCTLRIQKSDLTNTARIDPGIRAASYNSYYDGTSIWSAIATSPGTLARIDPGTLIVDLFTFPAGQNTVNQIAHNGNDLYVSYYTSPGYVSALNRITPSQAAPPPPILPPAVSITSPVSGLIQAKSTTSIQASATKGTNPIARVDFSVNGSVRCSDTALPYSCSWNVPAAPSKVYQLQAKVYDATGVLGVSSTVTVTSTK